MICFSKQIFATLQRFAARRPLGVESSIVDAATRHENGQMCLCHEAYARIRTKHPAGVVSKTEQFAEPTVMDLATRAAYAAWRATTAALHSERVLVTEAEYGARATICDGCEHWDGAARFGLGKCNAPGCGCTKFKRWLATENCPLKKWPKL